MGYAESDKVELLCCRNEPAPEDIAAFVQYTVEVGDKGEAIGEWWVAIQEGGEKREIVINGRTVWVVSEKSLLDELVDFEDYFNALRKRVERDYLPDSDLRLGDTYVPSRITNEAGDEIAEDLEEYLRAWLSAPGQRHLALLGEYGQGKSTGTLMFAYRLIRGQSPTTPRIPILIELRGKSPATLHPLELLGAWAAPYRIDPKALMKLLIAGRLLLIFEGFDEMAEVANTEQRLNHFRALWRFAYPNSKLLITGRPNFFLDERELKQDLGVDSSVAAGPHCYALRLKPFTLGQIKKSLRWASEARKRGIVQLASRDHKFMEIVSRPSLLYIVGQLWDSPELVQHREHMTSAMVIDLFIRHSYRRQSEKVRRGPAFMRLSEGERAYFMNGIAAYMAAQGLPNQINRTEFEKAVGDLFRALPRDHVFEDSGISDGMSRASLKERLQEEDDPLEVVVTDVRTYGILVPDPSRSGALRFPHKSFFELLVGNYLARVLIGSDKVECGAIRTATGIQVEGIIRLPESVLFAGEKLSEVKSLFIGNDMEKVLDVYWRLLYGSRRGTILLSLSKMRFGWFFLDSIFLNGIFDIKLLTLTFVISLVSASHLYITPNENQIEFLQNFPVTLTDLVDVTVTATLIVTAIATVTIKFALKNFFTVRHHNVASRLLVIWVMIVVTVGAKQSQIESFLGRRLYLFLRILARKYNVIHALNRLGVFLE